ncbi:MAG: hypothetical protein CBB92_04010 [Flammeovirgaceae bacterium TMED32]|nr:MAG: hypothetical protein CBB92_04010 [Flammeovirgaceae bacterium TMED32]
MILDTNATDDAYLTTTMDTSSITDLTIAFWMRDLSRFDKDVIALGDLKIHLDYPNTSSQFLKVDIGTATNGISQSISDTSSWAHYAITYTTGTIKLYINGEEIATGTGTLTASTNAELVVGTKQYSASYANMNLDPFSLNDLRIYGTSDEYTVKRIGKLPKTGHFRIGADHIQDITSATLSNFSINMIGSYYYNLTKGTNDVNVINELKPGGVIGTTKESITMITGTVSPYAYEWNINSSTTLGANFFKVDNSYSLLSTFYNEFNICAIYNIPYNESSSTNENHIKIYHSDTSVFTSPILNIYVANDGFLTVEFNILKDKNTHTLKAPMTVSSFTNFSTNSELTYVVNAGYYEDHISLSLGIYDQSFNGSETSYIHQSIIIPLPGSNVSPYDIRHNSFPISLEIGGEATYTTNNLITSANIYNTPISQPDIYRLVTGSISQMRINSNPDNMVYNSSSPSTLFIDKFYKMSMTFSYFKDIKTTDISQSTTTDVSLNVKQGSGTNETITPIMTIRTPTTPDTSTQQIEVVFNSTVNVNDTNALTFTFDLTEDIVPNALYLYNTTVEVIKGKTAVSVSYAKYNSLSTITNNTNFTDTIVGVPFKDIDFNTNNSLEFRVGSAPTDTKQSGNFTFEDFKVFNTAISATTLDNMLNGIQDPANSKIRGEDFTDLQVWFRLQDFNSQSIQNSVSSSSGGLIVGTVQNGTNGISKPKSDHTLYNAILNNPYRNKYALIANHSMASLFEDQSQYITAPYNIVSNQHTVGIKCYLGSVGKYHLFTLGNIVVELTNDTVSTRAEPSTSDISSYTFTGTNDSFVNSWHTIVLTISTSVGNTTISMYIDGILKDTTITNETINPNGTNHNEIKIADNTLHGASITNYAMILEDFRVYNTILDGSRITRYSLGNGEISA